MAITKEQLEERKRFIGSSDIAALFTDTEGKSLDPFKNAKDIFVMKAFPIDNTNHKSTKSTSIGHRYEEALIQFAEGEIGCKIDRNPDNLHYYCKDHPIFACNLDGYVVGKPEAVEVKTTGLTAEWGEPGSDQVPFRVILQCQQQMLCTGHERVHIAVLLGRFGLSEEMFLVERNELIIKQIIERGEQFWNDHVLKKIPPEDNDCADIQTLRRVAREPKTYAIVPEALISIWSLKRQDRIDAEKAEKEAFSELLLELGEAEAARMDAGKVFTYFMQKGADKIDRKALKAQYPDVYEDVATENHYRVPRIKDGINKVVL